jgi:hypothetical protein
MVGLEYNMFLSLKYSETWTPTGVGNSYTFEDTNKRADYLDDYKSGYDMLLLQLGVGADFYIFNGIYLRPSLLWGIDFNRTYWQKENLKADSKLSIFKHRLDIGLSVGIRLKKKKKPVLRGCPRSNTWAAFF